MTIGELGTMLAVTSNGSTLQIQHNIPESSILHSHHSENLRAYLIQLFVFVSAGRAGRK
jgi:hypothetical protein